VREKEASDKGNTHQNSTEIYNVF